MTSSLTLSVFLPPSLHSGHPPPPPLSLSLSSSLSPLSQALEEEWLARVATSSSGTAAAHEAISRLRSRRMRRRNAHVEALRASSLRREVRPEFHQGAP